MSALFGTALLVASPVLAQATGGWTLNLDNTGFNPTQAGGLLQYTVRIDNNDNVAKDATAITFTIGTNPATPADAEFIDIQGLSNCAPLPAAQGASVTCDVPALAPAETLFGTAIVRPMVEGTLTLNAQMAGLGPSFSRQTTIQKGADLALALTVPAGSVQAGSLAQYSATVTNIGPYASDSATLVLPIPAGLAPPTSLPAGCSIAGGTISCTIAGLAKDATVTLDFESQVLTANASTITVAATVTGTSPRDGVSGNNQASADIVVTPGTDLTLAKTRSPSSSPILVGSDVTFTLTAGLVGDVPATATITDNVPANYQVLSVTPMANSGWVCPPPAGQSVICNFTDGPGPDIGITKPISVLARAITPTALGSTVINHATIESQDENTDARNNNDAQDIPATIENPVVDLVAHKSGPPRGLVTVGNTYQFRLSTHNRGNAGFSGPLSITDHLPAGLTLIGAAVPPGWSCLPGLPLVGGPGVDFTCTTSMYTPGAPLAPEQYTADIVLTVEVTAAGSFANGMTVGLDGDVDYSNNTVTSGVVSADGPNWADVGVNKTVVSPPGKVVDAGDEVTFAIELTNTGPRSALNVVLDDRLNDIVGTAAGGTPGAGAVTFSYNGPATAAGMSCNTSLSSAYARDLQCVVADLPVCTAGIDCPVVMVTVRAGGQGAKTNQATAYSTQTPDPATGNNSDQDSYTVTPRTDVTVIKSSPAETAGARAGQEITYVLTAGVPLTGLSNAANVTVTDTLPFDVIFLGATPSSGTCGTMPTPGEVIGPGNQSLVCNLGTIVNGAQQTVTVRVLPTTAQATTTIVNNVTVATSTNEPNLANNAASLSLPIAPPQLDLIISKTDTPDPVEVDRDVTYTITVQNTGPSDAFGVDVVDTLPTGGFVDPVWSGADCATNGVTPGSPGGTLICSIPHLPANQTAIITVTMKSVARGRWTNSVTVTSDETIRGYESPTDNNTSYEDTTVRERADLLVTKVPSKSTVDLREAFFWTITVTNQALTGIGLAEWVTLEDTLPTGMVLTQAPIPSTGSCSVTGQRIFCELGDMARGAVATITLHTKIISKSAEAAANTATAGTLSFEQTPANNTDTGEVTLVRGGSVSGTLYRDFDADDSKDGVDTGIAGIDLTLHGFALWDGAEITLQATTGADGAYSFPVVPPGTYSVSYGTIGEAHLIDGKALPGTVAPSAPAATASGVNTIDGIVITTDFAAAGHDFTRVPVPRVGLSKVVGTPTEIGDGSYTVPYTVTVRNLSLEPLQNITVTDVLDGAGQNFGSYGGATPSENQYTIAGAITGSNLGGGTVNAGFTGETAGGSTLASGVTLVAGASATVTLTVHVYPALPRIVPIQVLTNQAHVAGEGQYSHRPVTDLSNNTTNPDPNGNGIADEPGENDPTTVSASPTRSVGIVKVATPVRTTGTPAVGDRINYSFTVTNTGRTPLFNVAVTDPLVGLVWVQNNPIARLDPGAVDTTSFSAYYILTQNDLDEGQRPNTATVTGQWGVQGGTPLDVTNASNANVPALGEPGLTLQKVVESAAGIQNPTQPGDTIRYRFTVENTGNTTLRNVVVTDTLAGVAPDPAGAFNIGTMAPGATATVYANYPVTLANIDAGVVNNSAAAGGRSGPGAGTAVNTPPSTTSTPLHRHPALTLDKDFTGTILPVPRAGNTLTWTVTATNTGNVTLTSLVLTDIYPGASVSPASVASLVPGASTTFTVTAPLQQADIERRAVDNTATINFNSPIGPEPEVDASEHIDLPAHDPDIALTKIGDVSALHSPPVAGDIITYTITIRNTGNVALHDFMLTDVLPGVVIDTAPLTGLVLQPQNAANNATDTEVVVTATYAITTDDIQNGEVVNTARVDAESLHGDPVNDQGGTTFGTDDPTVTSLTQSAAVRLVKTITSTLPATPQAGDVITYGFRVENVGNVGLTNIAITDLVADVNVQSTGWTGTLVPGAYNDTAFTASYVLKQADIDAGVFANTARVTANGIGVLDPVEDISGTDITNDLPTEQPLPRTSGLSIVKSAVPHLSAPNAAGDTIDYTLVVTNTGNVTLTNVEVSDPLLSGAPLSTIPTLLPGAANAVTLNATYTVLQSDIEAGEVRNQASATFTTPTGPGTVPSNEIVVPLDRLPAIAVVKTAVSGLSDPAAVGETITYSFVVTNTGNLELTNVTLDDPLPGIVPASFAIGTLQPGESSPVLTATYDIAAADIRAGEVVNQATARGTHGSGPSPVTDLSGPTLTTDEPIVVPVLPAEPSLTLEKTAVLDNGGGYLREGDVITYTFRVTNTGNVPLLDASPRELGLTFGGRPAEAVVSPYTPLTAPLALGEVVVFTATYALTQGDINNAVGIPNGVVNVADATATYNSPIDGPVPTVAPSDTAELTLPAQEPTGITIAKRALVSSIRRGETAGFAIEVTNTSPNDYGLVSITDRLPPGFVYVEGSGTVDGAAAAPVVAGNTVTFEVRLRPRARVEIGLVLRALATTGPGTYQNTASGVDRFGTTLAPPAHASIRIDAEAVFDCSDVIGKVFDDRNGNGYQDEGEPGLPGVRLATVRGILITTDAHGRYSVPCAALPDGDIGSNFVLKVDERTLPTGFAMTTDNPAMARLTAGKMVEINFGASVGRQLRLDLDGAAFVKGSDQPSAALADGLVQLVGILGKERTIVTISYHPKGPDPLARRRIDGVVARIRELWRRAGEPYRLDINTDIVER